MSWSMGETEDLARRASKGAGLPWGLAEEAAFAVVWMEQRKLPGVKALATYLQSIGQPNDYHAGFCPIGNGSWIADSGAWMGSFPLEVRQPILMTPFIAQIVKQKSLALKWAGTQILISDNQAQVLQKNSLIGMQVERCEMAVAAETAKSVLKNSRVTHDRNAWIEVLLEFAYRTYAPASEMSRLMGAGAGLNDND